MHVNYQSTFGINILRQARICRGPPEPRRHQGEPGPTGTSGETDGARQGRENMPSQPLRIEVNIPGIIFSYQSMAEEYS